jgi:hypothetical protein
MLATTHTVKRRHKVTLPPLGAELYRKLAKKYFKTLESLEQFEPNYLHTLATTHKGNYRHNVTLAHSCRVMKGCKNISKLKNAWSNLNQNRYTYYLQPTKQTVGTTQP